MSRGGERRGKRIINERGGRQRWRGEGQGGSRAVVTFHYLSRILALVKIPFLTISAAVIDLFFFGPPPTFQTKEEKLLVGLRNIETTTLKAETDLEFIPSKSIFRNVIIARKISSSGWLIGQIRNGGLQLQYWFLLPINKRDSFIIFWRERERERGGGALFLWPLLLLVI